MPGDTNYAPVRIGVIFKPPAVLVIYRVEETGELRKRVMPVRNLRATSSLELAVQDMRTRHPDLLGKIPLLKINRMFRILQGQLTGKTASEVLLEEEEADPKVTLDHKGSTNTKMALDLKGPNVTFEPKTADKGNISKSEEEDTDLELDDNEIPLDKLDSGDDDFW